MHADISEGRRLFEGFVFKVATGIERRQAITLRQQIYTEEYGRPPDEELELRAHHLIAYARETREVIATMRVLGQECRPFEFEHAVDLSKLLPAGRNIAVTGGLGVRRDFRAVSRQNFIALGLFKLALAFARKEHITDYLTYVYPHLSQFYARASFTIIVPEFEHLTWGKMCLMHLDLIALEREYAESQTPLARLLFTADPSIQV